MTGMRAGGIGYERRTLFAYLLNAPSLVAIFLLAAYPIVYSGWISLHKYNLKRPRVFQFIGLDNYAAILSSPEFWSALWITIQFTLLVVTSVTVLGVLIALLLNQRFPGRGILRTLILLPWAIPPVVNGLMWQWIYDSKIGALNGLLVSLGIIPEYRGWLSDPTSALLALAFADVWNVLPLAVILLLAALQKIPAELYESARIDGAGPVQLFRYVTFPWLAQTLLVVLILQTLSAIRVFDVIYVLTAGGPGTSTTTLTWKTYLTTFETLDFGLGNAYAYAVSLITFGLALIYFRVLYRRGDFET
ncbi:MAG TPA: sugar ABC transporter permease [Casimicrobiaceae bacterium]|nr:sugar ABC transporter permease [Casimicrobiaceae bacterium]